ncbi:MAG: GNAT family N-acetyltransferase [Methanobacteriota archaeon]
MAGARVRGLAERDIDRAIALTDLEGWGYTREDFRRLIALHPDGCLAAESDGRLVGVLSTTVYGRLAFLGAVIVEPGRRGEGIGDAMMRAALDRLDDGGVETVRLNAYLHVVAFYERLGFRTEYDNVRWARGPMSPVPTGARPLDARALADVIAFDAPFFGASRARLLTHLASEFPRTFLVAGPPGRPAGYLVGNTSGGACEVGPWVVDPASDDAASDLWYALLAASGSASYAFTSPVPNRRADRFARSLGFEEVFRTRRMVRGPAGYAGRPEGVWGLAGLEKG